MKTVKQIHEFFKTNNPEKPATLHDLLVTIPDFISKDPRGFETMDMTIASEYVRIAEKMVEDVLLIRVGSNTMMPILNSYIAVNGINSSDPMLFDHDLEYGCFDFKYRGFAYELEQLHASVLPFVGVNAKNDIETGSAFYIGNNLFVTAAHCINGLEKFQLLMDKDTPLPIKQIAFCKDANQDVYDIAIIEVAGLISDIRPLELGYPAVLEEILVIGYPPIVGFDIIQTAETATIGSYIIASQKSSIGQVVATAKKYYADLDHFLINARVKGGNSGGPVINNQGKVVGLVIEIPADPNSDIEKSQSDAIGFAICLPAKYISDLIANQDVVAVKKDGEYYRKV